MKTEQEMLSEIESLANQENELLVYNFIVKNFLTNLKSIDTIEEYIALKNNNEIKKALLPKPAFFTFNLNNQKVESVFYTVRGGYDQVEISLDGIKSYSRGVLFYSGAGCCGGYGLIKDEQSFENQIRLIEYNVKTFKKEYSYHRLLDGKWVKTDLNTNDIVQIEIEKQSCDLPESFKEKLPSCFNCSCSADKESKHKFITAMYSDTVRGKIIKFLVISQQ
jgi:hypothetical protein